MFKEGLALLSTMMMAQSPLDRLKSIRERVGPAHTPGLDDKEIQRFLELDPKLNQVIGEAYEMFEQLEHEFGETLYASQKVS